LVEAGQAVALSKSHSAICFILKPPSGYIHGM
jgi:hypothetical protein